MSFCLRRYAWLFAAGTYPVSAAFSSSQFSKGQKMLKIGPKQAALVILSAIPLAAPAYAMPAISSPSPAGSHVVLVNGHHCDHQPSGHAGNHGYDGYYDDNENMGVLFKSFVTGTLFSRSNDADENRDAPPPKRRYQ